MFPIVVCHKGSIMQSVQTYCVYKEHMIYITFPLEFNLYHDYSVNSQLARF